MAYSQENGYVPVDIMTIMAAIMDEINIQFNTSYTMETFTGTDAYKFFYALVQRLQAGEVKTSEIFLKVQGYFDQINARISRPVTTNPGTIEKMEAEGYITSVKPMIEDDAGERNICVDVDEEDDDYDETKLEICTLISQNTVGGVVTQGTESETIVLSNGQSFDFKFHLPNRIPVWLRLTNTLSENNQVLVGSVDDVKQLLIDNIEARYRLGRNFEPQRYFAVSDAPWTSQVKLEYTDDITETSPDVWEIDMDAVWDDDIFNADFDDLFDIALARITVVED